MLKNLPCIHMLLFLLKAEHTYLPLKCGMHIVTSFQGELYKNSGSKGNTFTLDKSEKHYLSQVIKVNINNNIMLIVYNLDV